MKGSEKKKCQNIGKKRQWQNILKTNERIEESLKTKEDIGNVFQRRSKKFGKYFEDR